MIRVLFALLLSCSVASAQTLGDVEQCVLAAVRDVVHHPAHLGQYLDVENLAAEAGCSTEQVADFVAGRVATSLGRYPNARVVGITVSLHGSHYYLSGTLRGVHWLANGATVHAVVTMSHSGSCRLVSARGERLRIQLSLAEYLAPRVCMS